MNAKELLTSLQIAGRTYHSNKALLHGLESEKYNSIKKMIEESNKRMPTDYQESHYYDIIKISFDSLSKTLNQNDIKFEGIAIHPEKVPLYGTADLAGYNAFVKAEGDEKVIVFNNDLLKFTQCMIEIYAKEYWLTLNNLMNKHIKKILVQNFVDVMLCCHIFENSYAAIPLSFCEIDNLDDLNDLNKLYELQSSIDEQIDFEKYFMLEDQITISVYQWIAAHEYAHVVLGHLDNGNSSKISLCGHDVTEINFSYQKEYDADLLGAIITLESDDSLFPASGIFIAMSCILLSQLYDSAERSLTHPPIQDRMKRVFSFIDNNKQYLFTNYESANKIITSNYNIFKKVVAKILIEDIEFTSLLEMQKYVYKRCDIFNDLPWDN